MSVPACSTAYLCQGQVVKESYSKDQPRFETREQGNPSWVGVWPKELCEVFEGFGCHFLIICHSVLAVWHSFLETPSFSSGEFESGVYSKEISFSFGMCFCWYEHKLRSPPWSLSAGCLQMAVSRSAQLTSGLSPVCHEVCKQGLRVRKILMGVSVTKRTMWFFFLKRCN